MFSEPVFPLEDPPSRAFLRQSGSWGKQHGQKNPHGETEQWICRAVWARIKPHMGFWGAKESQTKKAQKKLETGDFGQLSSFPLSALCSRVFQMLLGQAGPCDSKLSLNHEELFGLSLQRALQSHECHEPSAEGTEWTVTFAVLAVWVWHRCGITHIKETESKLNQHFYSVLQLVLIVLYLSMLKPGVIEGACCHCNSACSSCWALWVSLPGKFQIKCQSVHLINLLTTKLKV